MIGKSGKARVYHCMIWSCFLLHIAQRLLVILTACFFGGLQLCNKTIIYEKHAVLRWIVWEIEEKILLVGER